METIGTWEHRGRFGSIALTGEQKHKGNYSLLLETPTKGTEPPRGGRPWGVSSAFLSLDNEDWTDWNRISFWIYPDLPGFKVVSIGMIFHNDGEEKVPCTYGRNGLNYQVLENQKWNKVYWEIAHLGRDKVTGIEILYRMQGNELGATEIARYFIDEIYLEKIEADHFEGWNVQSGQIAYNHAGYVIGFPKVAFTSDDVGQRFVLKDAISGRTVKRGVVSSQTTPVGTFQMMDFSDFNKEGMFVLEAGNLKTKPFKIGAFAQVYRNSLIKTINHFYTQRCGYAVLGIHDACHLDWLCMHEGKSIPIHGGWHDAGDLSQGLVNTAEASYSMMLLAEKLEKSDPVVSARLLKEAEWGLQWMLRTRFGDGYRAIWSVKDMWTDGIHGTVDDWNSRALNENHPNLVSATTQAAAAIVFKERNPFLAAHAIKCAIEDYGFGIQIDPRRMNVELAGAALNAALAIYEATSEEIWKKKAIEHADYIIRSQQQEDLAPNIPLKGFFYRTPDKEAILHYPHRCHEQDVVVGLVKLSKMFPTEAAEWKKAIRLYADYYKAITEYTAPYYMIPAGVYDLSRARNRTDSTQIMSGVKLNDRYYMKRFPVWGAYRGNSGVMLTRAKGLAVIANFLQDKALLDVVYRVFDWHLGMNPFAQSLMYGEGYRFAL
jgi:hypothetical protein